MSHVDKQYAQLVFRIESDGTDKDDRTGVGSRSVFGEQMRFDISEGKLPLLTTKEVYTRAIVHELLWMLSGDTNIRYLKENNVNIWDSWITPETAEYDTQGKLVAGDCPKVYGKQWRFWDDTRIVGTEEAKVKQNQGFEVLGLIRDGQWVVQRTVDQIANIIHQLRNNPDSRRIILSAWNVGEIDEMGLPPCHSLAQFWTRELTVGERCALALEKGFRVNEDPDGGWSGAAGIMDNMGIPRRSLSCQLYQR